MKLILSAIFILSLSSVALSNDDITLTTLDSTECISRSENIIKLSQNDIDKGIQSVFTIAGCSEDEIKRVLNQELSDLSTNQVESELEIKQIEQAEVYTFLEKDFSESNGSLPLEGNSLIHVSKFLGNSPDYEVDPNKERIEFGMFTETKPLGDIVKKGVIILYTKEMDRMIILKKTMSNKGIEEL